MVQGRFHSKSGREPPTQISLHASGIKSSMWLAAFLKGKDPLNNLSLQLRGTNFEQTFVKPKKANKTSCLTIKHATIDSA